MSKPPNPKDSIALNKLPLHLWPSSATAMGCLALLDGASKYGRANWRAARVRATVYADALQRHMAAWMEGEALDLESGVPHLGHALACLAILVDASAAGTLIDDRQYPGKFRPLMDTATSLVAEIREKHNGKQPKHYTIEDARPKHYTIEDAPKPEPNWQNWEPTRTSVGEDGRTESAIQEPGPDDCVDHGYSDMGWGLDHLPSARNRGETVDDQIDRTCRILPVLPDDATDWCQCGIGTDAGCRCYLPDKDKLP